jgi:hypothetical protein
MEVQVAPTDAAQLRHLLDRAEQGATTTRAVEYMDPVMERLHGLSQTMNQQTFSSFVSTMCRAHPLSVVRRSGTDVSLT